MRIDALSLLAPDPVALAAFYGGILGLPVIHPSPGEVLVQVGGTRLRFAAAPSGWAGAYHFAINIPENQFTAAHAWLSPRVPLLRSNTGQSEFDFAHWEAHALYFLDPAGNVVEFIARHALNNASARPFDSQSLLNISELGLASPDVSATVAQFQQAAGLSVFRGSLGDDFAAVGSETGLFIIVREGRMWFPDTRVPAGPWAVSALVSAGAGAALALSGPPYQLRFGDSPGCSPETEAGSPAL